MWYYYPDDGQMFYNENCMGYGTKLKINSAIEIIQFVEKQILEDHLPPDAAWVTPN